MSERGARLLVADDNKVNRLLLARSLEQQGHRVALAENGRIALDMLRQALHSDAFDLLLLDIEMPELDGFGVLEQLKDDRALRGLPVIVTSSVEGLANVVRCIELGAEDYLPKPVNAVLLRARINAGLEKKRLRDQQRCAVRAALEMSESIALFNADRQAGGKPPLKIGIGIATGEVVAGYTGTQQRATYTCIGDTVNLAARLEAYTKEVQRMILIDAATHAALSPLLRADALGPVQLKGKAGPVNVFAVDA